MTCATFKTLTKNTCWIRKQEEMIAFQPGLKYLLDLNI